MTRYTDRHAAEAAYYVVEIAVGLGGSMRRMDAMYAFHGEREIVPRRGSNRRVAGRTVTTWRFAESKTAAAFADRFSGQVRPV